MDKKTILIVVAVVAVVLALVLIFANPFDKTKKMVGKYELVEVSSGSLTYSGDQLKTLGMEITMEIKKDKTGTMTMMGETQEFKIEGKDFVIGDDKAPYTFKDKKITLEQDGSKMVFEKK